MLRPLSSIGAVLLVTFTSTAPASAQAVAPAGSTERDAEALDVLHAETIHARRSLATSVLIGGLASVVGGAALIVPPDEDQGFRFAGVNTAIFGVVNTAVGLLALHGINAEERAWGSEASRSARRTPLGLARAKIHAVNDERRESVAHAINLGLGAAYLGVAGTAILASRLGVEHPNRWLGSGVAIGAQALFLVGVDFIGLSRSQDYHRAFVDSLMPSVAVLPTGRGVDVRLGLRGTF